MIYLDYGATSFYKPPQVKQAVCRAMDTCASPGRGGYPAAMEAAETVYACREAAGALFHCPPEQVVMTGNCTHGLNIAIRSLVSPGEKVVVSGFEHNAVMRPLRALGADVKIAGRKLFDWEDTLEAFDKALTREVRTAVFTHVSNVFGYILPVREIAAMCRDRGIPFILDAAQSAGTENVDFEALGAEFIAMPGHKGLLGPQGTGLLLCRQTGKPLLQGGTGSLSTLQQMPDFLPDAQEAGTLNVPGIAGLLEGIRYVSNQGPARIAAREHTLLTACAKGLRKQGFRVFSGKHQAGTLSFCPEGDCETGAALLGRMGIAVRAGLHCAPLAHESAGTLETGTIRLSFGWNSTEWEKNAFLQAASKLAPGER